MKLRINPKPHSDHSQVVPADIQFIQQPQKRVGVILSIIAGLIIPVVPFIILTVESYLFPRRSTYNGESIPWWIIFPVLIICIVFHELLHLIWHPGWGLSEQSSLNIWPKKVQFGVHYDGFMYRSRWLVMRLAPLVGLTLLPTIFLMAAHFFRLPYFWQQFVILLILINSLGSGGDFLASVIVYRQVPAHSEIGIWNGRACWRA
ncbi:DUF3267 domain-containing protein [Candidatus Leptofilum sp.]|uniref:DUF3267 domain-containing protein n=1 Tax=Candidatus Leptofilum sp. TaxID=3241576 RepID=UPI003B5AB473